MEISPYGENISVVQNFGHNIFGQYLKDIKYLLIYFFLYFFIVVNVSKFITKKKKCVQIFSL